MLDKRSEYLLRLINESCKEGSYQVLEVDDLVRDMPKKYKIDAEGILQIVGYLKNGEYVSVKYSDDHVICVCPLPRGRRIFEVEQDEKKTKRKRKWKNFIFFLP